MSSANSSLGFDLERLIHNALHVIPDITCKGEQDIRTYFNDQSLNGIDHWIKYGSVNIFIQDKWRETTTQPEVAQFLTCVERIQSRIPKEEAVYLIWAGKYEPTSHAKKALTERSVQIVNSSTSIYSLARCVVLDVCEVIDIDPIPALMTIPVIKADRSQTAATERVSHVQQTFDETDEGKALKEQINSSIRSIQSSVFQKINNVVMCSPQGSLIRDIVQTTFPKSQDEYFTHKSKKINYNTFLTASKKLLWATKTKKTSTYAMFLYCKLRFLSIELANQNQSYDKLRLEAISKGSTWAKGLAEFKIQAEPMAETEFNAAVKHCDDYWNGVEYQFWNQYQVF